MAAKRQLELELEQLRVPVPKWAELLVVEQLHEALRLAHSKHALSATLGQRLVSFAELSLASGQVMGCMVHHCLAPVATGW